MAAVADVVAVITYLDPIEKQTWNRLTEAAAKTKRNKEATSRSILFDDIVTLAHSSHPPTHPASFHIFSLP